MKTYTLSVETKLPAGVFYRFGNYKTFEEAVFDAKLWYADKEVKSVMVYEVSANQPFNYVSKHFMVKGA